tara:strand:- start:3031 stop:3690 length:660 start_codon:yes stop_codon:yes gene_type:complete
MYFIKKLYRALKVPATRIDPTDRTVDPASILREELKFAKFIIRLQQKFAAGIKRGFVTHLKLTGLWNEYDLCESNLDLNFNVPTNYFEMRQSALLELKATNFNSLASNEFISTTFAQKKYLGWKDKDILANREFLRKDAEMQWELAQIAAAGPLWKEQLAAAAGAGGDAEVGGEGAGVAGGDGGIPEFGGGPAADGGEADVDLDTPEADTSDAEVDAGE